MEISKVSRLVLSIAVCEAAGVLGSFFTIPAISSWYQTLNKPSFTPPGFIFGPVWTALYLLMGISLYLIWDESVSSNAKIRRLGLKLFFAQLLLNILWSIIFFGRQNILGGLVVIVVLWVAILLTVINFQKLNRVAAYLLYPYLAWVSFAAFLNFIIWQLNR